MDIDKELEEIYQKIKNERLKKLQAERKFLSEEVSKINFYEQLEGWQYELMMKKVDVNNKFYKEFIKCKEEYVKIQKLKRILNKE